MKFQIPILKSLQNPILKFVQTDGHTQSNMPLQLFQSWGHKNSVLSGQVFLG